MIDFGSVKVRSATDALFYEKLATRPHMRRNGRAFKINPLDREFIAFDGEGCRDKANAKRQSYCLFGTSEGTYIQSEELSSKELLNFIVEAGERNPKAWFVGFAFEYDVNMILRGVPVNRLRQLKNRGWFRWEGYRIEHIPRKWFQVTKYGPSYDTDKRDRITVRINETWGFFQSSFLKAIRSYIPSHSLMAQIEIIEQGKAERNNFTYEKIDFIKEYWSVEIKLMVALVEQLREYLYDVNLNIKQWHGPGAIANYGYREHGIKDHKQILDPEIYECSRFGYAGGRFERFQIGRFGNGYGLDINSAYPYAISTLPSLTEGTWRKRTGGINPGNIVEFGIYHVVMDGPPISALAGPLFHRDKQGNISYPWRTDGWYWSPEVSTLRGIPGVQILKGWEYTGWESRPFGFVRDVYEQRRELKRLGIGSQIVLKLFLNSLYGKMAQRVGWERTGGPPTWHQLEWAGYVTSATRAKLFNVMRAIPAEQLIAVETDGIYTTADPASLGVTHSMELGGWEITPFDEILYLQSGMYSARHGECLAGCTHSGEFKGSCAWSTKYRGLDSDSITVSDLQTLCARLTPGRDIWPMLEGPTTRFVGYRHALWRQGQNMGSMKDHMCRWETKTVSMSAGSAGKRVHSPKLCTACSLNLNALEMPHQTVIRSSAAIDRMSHKHDIPWLEHDTAEWRAWAEANAA